jgi:poly(A) polymerase
LKSSVSVVEGAWLADDGLRAVLHALDGNPDAPNALIVGGAVRDAVLGRSVGDIDIATRLEPATVSERLADAGIKTVPTGLAHGTVTAVVGGRAFEITTLRKDVETDGRRAKVAFTDDWAADAARRDFTMNALYCDRNGRVFDPTGEGLDDARAGRVRFIGRAEERIAEDYLRLLRFFRFRAHYGRGDGDVEALAACARAAPELARLSGERLRQETLRLLAAPDPGPTIRAMADAGVLEHLMPGGADVERLARLVGIETRLGENDPIRRLAALRFGFDNRALAERLRLSNAERDRLLAIGAPDNRLRADMNAKDARALIHALGAQRFRDLVMVYEAGAPEKAGQEPWRKFCALSESWEAPEFPLRGADLVKAGIAPGKEVGALLQDLETWWIDRDFVPDREALLAELRRRLADPGRSRA